MPHPKPSKWCLLSLCFLPNSATSTTTASYCCCLPLKATAVAATCSWQHPVTPAGKTKNGTCHLIVCDVIARCCIQAEVSLASLQLRAPDCEEASAQPYEEICLQEQITAAVFAEIAGQLHKTRKERRRERSGNKSGR